MPKSVSLTRRQVLALGGSALFLRTLEAWAQGEALRIGAVLLSRPGSEWEARAVEALRMGLEMARDEYGENAALLGQRLDVVLREARDREVASQEAERLIRQEEVYALVGGLGGQAEALMGVAERLRVPFLNVGDPSDRLRNEGCRRYAFHLEASAAMYLDALAAWFVQAGFRSWFLVYPEGREGQALYQRARKSLLERHFGAREVGRAVVAPARPDFRPVLEALRRTRPQAVLLLLGAEAQLSFLAQYEPLGLPAQVTGFPYPETQTRAFFAASRARARRAGAGYRAVLWEAKLDAYGARELNARFLERYRRPMDPSAWAGYQSVKILYEAAAFGGGPEPARVRAYLENPQTVFDVHKGIGVSFRPWDHQLRQSLYLVKVSPEAQGAWDLATLVGELPAIYRPGTDPVERLDQIGDLRRESRCRFGGGGWGATAG
ncbi:hypothetical protein Thermus77359_22810 [Thermus oshimai]|jgi:ABC-type branched-subunit amino acid transport system substrate-binding protein